MRTPTRPLSALSLGIVTALAVSACGGSEDTTAEASSAATEVTVAHAQGQTAVPADPQRVVVFDIGVLSTLDSLGVEVAGVPEATFPESLARYAGDGYPKVGSLFEPDYEAVNALEPDLIIVAGRSAAVYPQLAEIAPTIDLSVDNADFLASFEERTTTLGEVFGEQDAVAGRLAAIETRAAEVREAAQDDGEALVVMTSASEVSAYGAGSRFGIVHDELGLGVADEDLTEADHGDAVSFEYLAETDPDIMLVLDRDAAIGESGAAARAVLDNELVRGTTAWRNGDVHYLDSSVWYVAPNGLPSVETMIDEVAAAVE
ncbi:iron complex transport system substrate-binding protein [Geodermatophilus pulveris]|uniref:Iron complex transport system substrate-binding protein n=1 Tax=Geodermatophilus pulveris TaxID=1564159 RepID=A0A239FU20_9ACTN|nr:siderophore ABC transporter substrate-binding protein [Geodermatophilus pulveris]SNS60038.1 iron complex transport system substrate-binding protein [Geodermatophilus pulveris]